MIRDLEKQKYPSKIREHLHLAEHVIKKINWNEHEEALKNVDGTYMRKLIWKNQPMRERLKVTIHHPSALFPLCDKKDVGDQLFQCHLLNS